MAEVGTRLGQQLAKLARGLAMLYGKKEVTEIEYQLVKKVMLDTISQRNEDVLRSMIGAMGGPTQLIPMSLRDIAMKTHYPFETIRRLAQDLAALQIIRKSGSGATQTWALSDYVAHEIRDSGLYLKDDELIPRIVRKIVLRRPRKKDLPRSIRIPLGQVDVVQNQNGNENKITISMPVPVTQELIEEDEDESTNQRHV